MKTKIMRYHGAFHASLDTLDMPPLSPGRLRCKALYSVVSTGTEAMVFAREFDELHYYPKAMLQNGPSGIGYSMAAQVVELGAGVTGWAVGDVLYADAQHSLYFDIEPLPGAVEKTPDWMRPDEACWTCILRTCQYAVKLAQVQPGGTLAVLGQGIFGALCVQLAKLYGAKTIFAIDPNPLRADRSIRFGATDALCGYARDRIGDVAARTNGALCESVIDATASPAGLEEACALARRGGHIALLADPPNPMRQHVGAAMLCNYLNIHGVYIRMQTLAPNPFAPVTAEDTHKELYAYMREGKLRVQDMITDYVSPADCETLYQELYDDRGAHLGVLYDWSRVADPNA